MLVNSINVKRLKGSCIASGKKPFPYFVFDDVVDSYMAKAIEERYPRPEAIHWFKYDNPLEKKLATPKLNSFHLLVADLLLEMNHADFLTFLEETTGIKGLIPDPHFNGGGLHQIERGGFLHVHEDYNYHPVTHLDRRLNVILFLNRGWKSEWGGELELWNRDMTKAVVKIEPIFNRMVVFETNPESYHGHPDPLKCPEGVTRKSLASYYYTNGRPYEQLRTPHSTLFQKRASDPSNPEMDELRRKRGQKRLEDKTT